MELLTIKIESLTPSYGDGLGAGWSKLEQNKVPMEDYL